MYGRTTAPILDCAINLPIGQFCRRKDAYNKDEIKFNMLNLYQHPKLFSFYAIFRQSFYKIIII